MLNSQNIRKKKPYYYYYYSHYILCCNVLAYNHIEGSYDRIQHVIIIDLNIDMFVPHKCRAYSRGHQDRHS